MTRKRTPGKTIYVMRYTLIDEMLASATELLEADKRARNITAMRDAFWRILHAPMPGTDDWRLCSDAVNMVETFVTRKTWLGCDGQPIDVEDSSGLLADAITALAMAGMRHKKGGHIRLDAAGIAAVRAILDDYETILSTLPARAVIACHRATEKRIHEILRGKRQPHDVEIMSI